MNKEKKPKSYKKSHVLAKKPKLIKKEQKEDKFQKESRVEGQRIKTNKSKGLI
jgi:hypothetical protein